LALDPADGRLDAEFAGADRYLGSSDRGFPVARLSQDIAMRVAGWDGRASLFIYKGIQEAYGDVQYVVPKDAFAHTDPGAIVRLQAHSADGGPLPSWLEFDSVSGILRGIPPAGVNGFLDILLIARDDEGRQASIEFRLQLGVAEMDPAEKRVELDDARIMSNAEKEAAEKDLQKHKTAGKEGVSAAADKAAGDKQKEKRGAATFNEQVRAEKIARDPVLAKILESPEKHVKRTRM
jgi:hypothetical protein